MSINGVALIKVGDCSGIMNVSEFYGAFVRGKLLIDAGGSPRKFESHAEAVRAFMKATKPAERSVAPSHAFS